MREDALDASVRLAAGLNDLHPDYTAARLRLEADAVIANTFGPTLAAARSGRLLKRNTITLTADISVYPLPARAMSGTLESVHMVNGTESWPLTEVRVADAWQYEQLAPGRPQFYCVTAASIRLFPAPSAAHTLRYQYALKPSRLVEYQANGYITAVSQSARTITVNASPTNRDTAAAISGTSFIDCVRAGANANGLGSVACDASAADISAALSGTVFTVAAGYDMSEVQPGDWVRASDQTDWPMLPAEFHETVAYAIASRICLARGDFEKSAGFSEFVRNEMARMRDMIEPVVKSSAPVLIPRAHAIRRIGGF